MKMLPLQFITGLAEYSVVFVHLISVAFASFFFKIILVPLSINVSSRDSNRCCIYHLSRHLCGPCVQLVLEGNKDRKGIAHLFWNERVEPKYGEEKETTAVALMTKSFYEHHRPLVALDKSNAYYFSVQ